MYPSVFNSFPVIQTSSAKNHRLTAAHIFVSPGDAPQIITQYVAWMEIQFNACQTPRSMYLPIFNNFGVIRCLSQCVSTKIAIFTTFWFPLRTPLALSRQMLYGWKENSVLAKPLAACTRLSSTVSQLFIIIIIIIIIRFV